MTANDRSEELLQESFERLKSQFDQFSTDFYEELFRRSPELRNLFRDDLTGQGMKFLTTLREVSKHARDAIGVESNLSELGNYHANLGVTATDFAPMEEALIETLRKTLGDEFTAELESAWRRAYTDMSVVMIREGAISKT